MPGQPIRVWRNKCCVGTPVRETVRQSCFNQHDDVKFKVCQLIPDLFSIKLSECQFVRYYVTQVVLHVCYTVKRSYSELGYGEKSDS